ncbi:MAG: hypothetical protein LBD15_03490 [Holosporales bacterium]|jgi:hypothetical protein|nr:hypothetical protein [Holosporales bacterium]
MVYFREFLSWLGNYMLPADYAAYAIYADIILKDSSWLHTASVTQPNLKDIFDDSFVSETTRRLPGYPLFIAFIRYIFGTIGTEWRGFLVFAQLVLLIWSGYALYRLARKLGMRPWIRWVLFVGYTTGYPFCYALLLNTNSIHCSLAVIALVLSISACLNDRTPRMLGLASCLFILCLWRESGFLFTLSLFFLWGGMAIQCRWRDCCKMSIICLGVAFVVNEGLCQWNQYRTGERFASAGFLTAYAAPLSDLAQVAPFFLDHTCLRGYRHILTESRTDCPFADVCGAIAQKMYKEQLSARQMLDMLTNDYITGWLKFPIEQFKVRFINKRSLGWLTYSTLWPFSGFSSIEKNYFPKDRFSKEELWGGWDPPKGILPNFIVLFHLITSCILSLFCLFYVCVYVYEFFKKGFSGKIDNRHLLYLGIFLQASSCIFITLLVHMEYRYVLDSISMISLLGWWAVEKTLRKSNFNRMTSIYRKLLLWVK